MPGVRFVFRSFGPEREVAFPFQNLAADPELLAPVGQELARQRRIGVSEEEGTRGELIVELHCSRTVGLGKPAVKCRDPEIRDLVRRASR